MDNSDEVHIFDIQQPPSELSLVLGRHWEAMRRILAELCPDEDADEKLAEMLVYVESEAFDDVDRWSQYLFADGQELIDLHVEFAVHFGVRVARCLANDDHVGGWGQMCSAIYHQGVLDGRIYFGQTIKSKKNPVRNAGRLVVSSGGVQALKQQVLVLLAEYDWASGDKPKNLGEMIDAIRPDLTIWMGRHDLTRPGLDGMARAITRWAKDDPDFDLQLQEVKKKVLS